MKDKTQYNQETATGEVPVTKPTQITTQTPTDIKIKKLEEMIVAQHQELAKLRRELSRLKGHVDDIVTVIKDRG